MRRFAIPFLDVMTLLVLVLLLLIFAALMKISDTQETKNAELEAQYVLTLTWSDGSRNDIDLSLMTPSERIVWFSSRQGDFAALDNDDLGQEHNTVIVNGQEITLTNRQEVVYIRQVVPGTYTANVHFYRKASDIPEEVTVTLVAVQPHWREVATRTFTLTQHHEERTAFRFSLDGEITIDTETERHYINGLLSR